LMEELARMVRKQHNAIGLELVSSDKSFRGKGEREKVGGKRKNGEG